MRRRLTTMRLYDYQEQYIAKIPNKAIMAAGLGLGKTAMALIHYQRSGVSDPLLVVGPAAKLSTGDWEREADRWLGIGHEPIHYISYQKLGRMNNKVLAELGKTRWAVITEECHAIKNPQSKQSKAVFRLGYTANYFIGLSGTPLPNGWIDWAGYSKLFGYTQGITEFKRKYCNIATYKGFPEIVGYYNEKELGRQYNEMVYPLARDGIADLPDKQFIGVTIKKPAGYDKIKRSRIGVGEEWLDSAPRLAHYLRQYTVEARLPHLEDVLTGTDDNIVIFYNYVKEREAILKLLAKSYKDRPVFRFDGEKHELPAHDDRDALRGSITLAHYASGSEGIELQYANVTVYFSPTYSYKQYAQSIGRTSRNGQTKKCLYYCFRVENSIDSEVWHCLKAKRDFQAELWQYNEDNLTPTL